MSRKRKPQAHSNHERWMVSYADFVTLLFAFFVVMFATAKADSSKAGEVSAAVRAALDEGKVSNVLKAFTTGTNKDKARNASSTPSANVTGLMPDATNDQTTERLARAMLELLPSMELLKKELRPEIESGKVELHMEARGLAISFKQAAFFDSGSSDVKAAAIATIGKVGAALIGIPNAVRLEGHTDSIPIHTDKFASNWDLSAARAIAVLDILTSRFQVPRSRLAIGGYAEVAPVASNDTEEGRARNRRVDVVILSEFGASAEPAIQKSAMR
jgi:chemotaxis protein MotB